MHGAPADPVGPEQDECVNPAVSVGKTVHNLTVFCRKPSGVDSDLKFFSPYLQQTLLHCDPFPLKILKARQELEQYGGPLEAPDSLCPALLKGKADQVLAVPVSQITARVGCNPAGTDFIEALSQSQVASSQE